MPETGETLPEPIEEELFEIHFETQGQERDQRVQRLCETHPQLREAIRERYRALRRSDEALGSVQSDLSDTLEHEQIGAFTIERVLGEGGFGTVYLAEQHEPVRRKVALKVLQSGRGDTRARQRFEDERQLLARLQHACIAQVYDAGITADRVQYFAMEYVDGSPITQWCREHDCDTETRLRLFVRVCAAIHHAHQREIVHRDIKPSNVLVREEDGAPMPKIIDFGIAKLLAEDGTDGEQLTMQGGLIGTPGYMSPEQAKGELIDSRTDVYSLGVLLCELLTGDLPLPRDMFASTNFAALAGALASNNPRRPSKVAADDDRDLQRRLREDLDWVVLKAIAADREQRYSSVAALAEDIERHLRNEPVEARQRASSYLFRRFLRRHRIAVATAALVLCSLIGAIISLAWGLEVASDARSAAETDRDIAQSRERSARMAAAQMALQRGDDMTAYSNLANVPEEHRHWEWRHLAAQMDTSLLTRASDPNTMSLTWLDAERVLSCPRHGEPYIWATDTGENIRTIPFTGTLRKALFDRERNLLLIAADHGLSLWNIESGEKVREYGKVPSEPFAVAWTPDKSQIVVCGNGKWFERIDATTGERVERRKLIADGTSLLVTDELLIIGYRDGRIEARSRANNELVWAMSRHTDHMLDLIVSDDGVLFSASLEGGLFVSNLADGTPIADLSGGHRVQCLALSTDGSTLYGAGGWSSGWVRAWETTTYRQLGSYHGHVRGIRAFAVAPDNGGLVTTSRDETTRIWPAKPPTGVQRLYAGRDARVLAVDLDGTHFAAASMDGRITVWDAETLEADLQLDTDHSWTGTALGREHVYVAGSIVRAYDIATGEVAAEGHTNKHRVEDMLTDPQERWLIAGHTSRVLVWRLPDLELLHDLALPIHSVRLAWDSTAERFLVGGKDATLHWLDPTTGNVDRTERYGPDGLPIMSLAVHDDAIVTGVKEGLVIERSGRRIATIPALHLSAAISTDGERLAIGGPDHVLRMFDLSSGDPVLTLEGPRYALPHVHFVHQNRRVIGLAHRWYSPCHVYVWTAPDEAELGR